jgi:hypothetical protein
MTRAEFVQRLVLDTICDDFENVDQVILRDVSAVGAKCGLAIQRGEVVDALKVLVADGMARAYDLSGVHRDPFAGEIQGMPPLDAVEEYYRTYFLITNKGTGFHEADETWWPLDGDGELRSDWSPPDLP